eukprot:SAG11_NODE_917_length_6553_cov_24.570654_2_plen_124_part_00
MPCAAGGWAGWGRQVVLSLGAGSGMLAIFAAQAGASTVYALEPAAEIAECCRALVAANGFELSVVVLCGAVETVALPERGPPHRPHTARTPPLPAQPELSVVVLCGAAETVPLPAQPARCYLI